MGLGSSLSHTSNIVTLHFPSPSKEESKYLFCLGELVDCPQIVSTRREWYESLFIDIVASICPTLASRSWKIRNLLMREIVERAPDLSLSKVYFFLDILKKLSSFQASVSPYWNVISCQEAASLLSMKCSPAFFFRSVSFRWLKSHPMMMWAVSKLALFSCFHISAHSLEVRAAYMLTIVKFPLFESLRVMNYALPSRRMPLEVIWGVRDLSTKIEVPALNLYEHPIGMPWFQKEVFF